MIVIYVIVTIIAFLFILFIAMCIAGGIECTLNNKHEEDTKENKGCFIILTIVIFLCLISYNKCTDYNECSDLPEARSYGE